MENKFKELLKKTKAHRNGESKASKSFEFAIFKESSWFLSMNNLDNVSETINSDIALIPNPIPETIPEKILETSNALTKVLFVGDTFDTNSQTEDLLGKMIIAMKLNENDFARIALNPNFDEINDLEENLNKPSEEFQLFLNKIEELAPVFVISLGATITNLILGRREKMTTIHGKFFKSQANAWEFQLMPIFHPDFLLINPNMKRTAWIDLQLVMESIGKN